MPIEVMRTAYEALYKFIIQYSLIVCAESALRHLIVQQNLAVRICLDEKETQGFKLQHFKSFTT